MKFYTVSSFLSGIALFSFFWTPCVIARHRKYICEGDRNEGDKWFDGCRWCVCQIDGPLCSPASCSHLVTQVPPCENLGSRWRDGCYQCTCKFDGIECIADSSCVILMQREEYQRQILSPGACVEPKDDRCVCGVDGVPSCTAEVIDRNAHPATTIALGSSTKYDKSQSLDFGFRHLKADDWHHRRVKRRSTLDEYLKRREQTRNSYNYRRNNLRSSYHKPYRFFNRACGYYNYADTQYGYPNRGYHVGHKTNARKRCQSYKKKPSSFRGDDRSRHNIDEYNRDVVNDESRGLQTPKSLLIITNNRCMYGVRWYGGGLRCYCNEDDSITCGDPKFVATRIDGFRMEKYPCEEGHVWNDERACQVCECKISGVVLCRRSETCPLPFLIKPVQDFTSEEFGPKSNDASNSNEDEEIITASDSKKTIDRRSGLKSYSRFPSWKDDDAKTYSRAHGPNDDKTIELPYDITDKPPLVIDKEKSHKYHKLRHNRKGNKKHTTVVVTECNPGSRWMDGCKRCSCDMMGRKYCDKRLCLKAAMHVVKPAAISISSATHSGRPFQRPPDIPIIRNKPVKIKSPFPKKNPCGRFKVNDVFLINCNRCVCTPHGPKCTAMNCG